MQNMQKFSRFGWLLTVVLVLVISGSGCSKMKKSYHEKRADKFFAAGQYDQAEIEYLNVLKNGLDPHAIGQLGIIYFNEGRVQNAAPYLYKGSELLTNDADLRLKTGWVYAAMGKNQEARNAADFVLDHDPENAEAPMLLVQVATTPKEIEAARNRLQQLAAAGNRPAYEVALGRLAFHDRDVKGAEADFRQALALDPHFAPAYESLGGLYVARNDLTNAAVNFKAAAENSPPRAPQKLLYVQFLIQTGDVTNGQAVLESIVKQTPDYFPAWMGLAGVSLAEKKYDEGQGFLDRILGKDANNYEALMLQSQLYLAQSNVPAATATLEKMVRLYPSAPNVLYQLASVYFAAGDKVKATDNLTRALAASPNFPDATMLLSQIQIQNQNPDPAIASLESLTQKLPQLLRAQLLLADAYRLRGRADDALAIYVAQEKAFPDNSQIPLLRGAALLQQKDNAGARQEFDRSLKLAPDNLFALAQLMDLDIAEKKYDAALQSVQSSLDKNPKRLQLYLFLARAYQAKGDRAGAVAAYESAIKLSPENPEAYLLLAQMYFDANQYDQATTQLNSVLAKNPKNLSALMLTAAIYGFANDYQKQADTYEKMLAVDPDNVLVLNNIAYLYAQNLNQLDRAYDLAQHARALMPLDPNVADTLGWVLFKRGSYAAALKLFQESAPKMPGSPDNQYHLGMANYMLDNEADARTAFQSALSSGAKFSGNAECQTCLAVLAINPQTADAAAQTLLEKRIADQPGDIIALGRLAAIYQYAGNAAKAIAAYEAILQIDPQNTGALINLAQLYASSNPAKAYALAKSAYQFAPNDANVTLIYGQLAYQNGDYKWAATLLQQATQNQPGNALAFFDYAQAIYALGRISDAQAAVQNAQQLNLAAPQSAEATRLLDLINLAANPAQAVAAGARIGGILKMEPNYVPALMASAVISEQNADAASAEVTYEKILTQFPDFAPAQRALALLYSREPSKLSQAYAYATKAATAYPNDPVLAKITAFIVLQQGNYSSAVDLLKQCLINSPNDAELYYYLGTAQFKLQSKDSKASLQKALSLNLSGTKADSARQMLSQLK